MNLRVRTKPIESAGWFFFYGVGEYIHSEKCHNSKLPNEKRHNKSSKKHMRL